MRSPHSPLQHSGPIAVTVAVLVALSAGAGCGRSALQSAELDTEPAFNDASADVATDVTTSDTQIDPTDGPDALNPAPEIPTPDRDPALDDLYCGLDNGHLVQAALRAGACLDISVAGVLLDAAHGFVYGQMMSDGYFTATYGNCDFLRCLSDAAGCGQANRCERARVGEECDGGERRCDGDRLEACTWNGEEYRWTQVQDCSRMSAECVEVDCEDEPGCFETALCEGEAVETMCDYYGACDGDTLVRCTDEFAFEPVGTAARINCGELMEGATCTYEPVGGEAPGPICTVVDDQECSNSFGEGFACTGPATASLCLYGRIVEVDCTDYGYSACEDLDFEGVRCVR